MTAVEHNHTTQTYEEFMRKSRENLIAAGETPNDALMDKMLHAFINAGIMDMDVDEDGTVYLTTRLEYTEAYEAGEV